MLLMILMKLFIQLIQLMELLLEFMQVILLEVEIGESLTFHNGTLYTINNNNEALIQLIQH